MVPEDECMSKNAIRLIVCYVLLLMPACGVAGIENLLNTMSERSYLEEIGKAAKGGSNYLPAIIDRLVEASYDPKPVVMEKFVKVDDGYDLNVTSERALLALELMANSDHAD